MAPVVGHDHEVFDTDASESFTIDPRLHGHYVPDLQFQVTGAIDERILVDQQADSVPGPMTEPFAVASLGDCIAAHRIEFGGADAGLDRVDAGSLGGEHHLVELELLLRRLTDEERARHVAVIAVVQRADIDDDRVPRLDSRVGRPVVRQRRVDGSRRHDRLVAGSTGSQLAHADLQPIADLDLGTPLEVVGNFRQGDISDPARLGHAGDLASVLAPALGLDHSADGHQRRREQALESLELLVGHMRCLEPDRTETGNLGRQRVEHRGARQADDHPSIDAGPRHLRGCLVAVSAIGDQDDPARSQQCPTVGTGEAGQPTDVGEIGDQEHLGLVETCQHAADSPGDLQRRHHDAFSLAATASTASR